MCPPSQPSCSVACAQATADAVAVTKRVRKLEAAFGAGYEPITDDYVEMFCRNAQYIRAYKYAVVFLNAPVRQLTVHRGAVMTDTGVSATSWRRRLPSRRTLRKSCGLTATCSHSNGAQRDAPPCCLAWCVFHPFGPAGTSCYERTTRRCVLECGCVRGTWLIECGGPRAPRATSPSPVRVQLSRCWALHANCVPSSSSGMTR